MFLLVVGAGLVVAALKGLLWYSVDQPKDTVNVAGDGFSFDDLGRNAETLVAPVASWYFDWLAWTLLVALVVAALLGRVSWRGAKAFRVTAFVLGVTALVATYYAMAQLFNAQRVAGGSSHSVWHNASYGLWAVLAGYALLMLVGLRGRGSED